MPTVEERLAMLEGRMDAMGDLRPLIANVGDQMHRGFEELRGQMDRQSAELTAELRESRGEMVRRFEQVDRRFEQVDRRFEHVEVRITTIDDKHDRHFTWLVGLQLTMMLAVVGVLLAAYLR